ncbi:MAG: LTA synthase family protein [Bacteroidia bacterium]
MRNIYFFLCLLFCFFKVNSQQKADGLNLVKQEIRYHCKEATEVYLVWGINNWIKQEQGLWPEGTYEKDGLLSTPMKFKDGVFSIELKAKPNTIIDYVFWITKGPKNIPCDIWDVNRLPQKDYHSGMFNDNITLINSKMEVKPKQVLSILDYSGWLLIITGFIFLATYLLKKYFYKGYWIKPKLSRIILSVGFVVFLCHIFCRASVAKLSWDLYYEPFRNFTKVLWTGYYDFQYVIALTLFFFGLNYVLRNFPRIQKTNFIVFISLCFLSVITGILNIKIVETIGKPFNYRWFYYSGFLNSADSKAAVATNVTASYILGIIYIAFASILISVLIIYFLEFILLKFKLRKVALVLFISINLGYLLKANSELKGYKMNYDLVANPVGAFIESVSPFNSDPELFTMDIPHNLEFVKPCNKTSWLASDVSKIKNVILLVLESTPAEYVHPYDSKYKATPTLEKYSANSIVFENIYAHAPATNKSMVCLLGSVYPWLSYTSITQEHPGVILPTISSELQKKGYRTAFFNSADNDFQRAGEFLANRRFDKVKDRKNLDCSLHFEETDHKHEALDGVDDECTANELMAWVNNKENKPFFGVMWTYQTHYPYYTVGKRKVFSESDTLLNRYLNAVNHSDAVLANILENLKSNNLYESTLIVVVGDHGEAFGRHNQFTHASKIYEENVHIPCMFINPAFNGERRNITGGSVDIAPTIMELLKQPVPEEWQGNSLFTKQYNDRTYFFCPWSDYLFGFKEGDMKYIFNATKNISEIYNIKNDPFEMINLFPGSGDNIKISQQKLAAWAQYQDKYMKKLLK